MMPNKTNGLIKSFPSILSGAGIPAGPSLQHSVTVEIPRLSVPSSCVKLSPPSTSAAAPATEAVSLASSVLLQELRQLVWCFQRLTVPAVPLG